ncbi:hypothetical protein [Haladaptatus sp. CMAA 1911]|uniref:hypothetical protein n=1 Tax=unclassified Haladaptatus TaxID=2622732 RepID=UPI003754BDB5
MAEGAELEMSICRTISILRGNSRLIERFVMVFLDIDFGFDCSISIGNSNNSETDKRGGSIVKGLGKWLFAEATNGLLMWAIPYYSPSLFITVMVAIVILSLVMWYEGGKRNPYLK